MATLDILSPYEGIIASTSKKYGIDPNLIRATIMTESGGNPKAYRYEPHLREASYGLGQTLLSTARGLGFKGKPEDLYKPEVSIDLTALYIKQALQAGAKTPQEVATFYNTGHLGGIPTAGHLDRFTSWYNQAAAKKPVKGEPTAKEEVGKPRPELKLAPPKEIGASAKPIAPVVLPRPKAPTVREVRGVTTSTATPSARPTAKPTSSTRQPMPAPMPTIRSVRMPFSFTPPPIPRGTMMAPTTARITSAMATPSAMAPMAIARSTPAPAFHIVRAGETPGGIAQRYTGNWRNWRQFWGGDPRRMPVGIKIPVPSVAAWS